MFKTIKSNEINGFISAQMKSAKSITFCGNLPENAKATSVRLLGKVEVNGTIFEDTYIENLDGAVVQYHNNDEEIATVYFLDGIPEKLLAGVQSYNICDFEVECRMICPCCGR